MKEEIHPQYFDAQVTCGGCGNKFIVGSTVEAITVNVCSECHPFYTGKQKLLDSEGRVERFKKKYAKFQKKEDDSKSGSAEKAAPQAEAKNQT